MTTIQIRVGHHYGPIFWLIVGPVVLLWWLLKWTALGFVALVVWAARTAQARYAPPGRHHAREEDQQ